jgi:hypothetical protein
MVSSGGSFVSWPDLGRNTLTRITRQGRLIRVKGRHHAEAFSAKTHRLAGPGEVRLAATMKRISESHLANTGF